MSFLASCKLIWGDGGGGGGSNWTPRQVPQKHWLCMESVMYKCIKLHFHINSVHVFAILYMVDNLVEYYLVF